jgi:hypothetical protein
VLNQETKITLDASGVQFTNATNHGLQLIRVTTRGEPSIYAASVTLEDGHIVHRPLSLSVREIMQFISKAQDEWSKR